jgi:hypothetical protein
MLDKKLRLIIMSSFFLYLLGIIIVYFILSDDFGIRALFSINNEYNINMFNLIPLKNLLKNLVYNVNIRYLKNVIYSFVIWIPSGYFGYVLNNKKSFLGKMIFLLIFVNILFLMRTFLLRGYYDIDKAIIALISFSTTYYVVSFSQKIFYIDRNKNLESTHC